MIKSGRAAVYEALEELGDKTSIAVLVEKASRLTKVEITYGNAVTCRLQWRKEKEISNDNRTYDSQNRRNMFRDDTLTLKQVKRLNEWFKKHRVSGPALLELIGKTQKERFHSIEQLTYAMEELDELRKAA